MISEKILRSTNLPKTQVLDIQKLAEIVMIGKDKNFKFETLQVVASVLKVSTIASNSYS